MALPSPPANREQDTRSREPRVNHRIRVPEVRLVGVEGDQLGVVSIEEAMRMAQELSVDLVEVAAAARPPVCRLMDYGKFKYLQKKKAADAKRTSTHVEVKEVKLRPKTDDHDFETKVNQARRFLQEGNRVKMTIMFRGREIAYAKFQHDRLMEIAALLSDCSAMDVPPKVEGRNMSMMLNAKRGGSAVAKPADAPAAAPAAPVAPAAAASAPAAAPAAAPTGPQVIARGGSSRPV
jgi:translation initiation factor IF-3